MLKTRDIAFFAGMVILPSLGLGMAPAMAFEAGQSAEEVFGGQNLVAEKLQIKLDARNFRSARHASDRAILAAFYKQQNYQPLWVSHGRINEKGRKLIH